MEALAMATSQHRRASLLLGVAFLEAQSSLCRSIGFSRCVVVPHVPSPREGGRSMNDPTLHG